MDVAWRGKTIAGALALALSSQVVVVRPLAAEEAPAPTARERFQNGVEAAQRGELARAAAEFEAAYALNPKPGVLYNLGLTQSALGRPVEAVRSLRQYLKGEPPPDAERVREVEELIRTNERQIGTLDVDMVPTAAKLEVDAKPVELEAGKLMLAAGRHVLVASLDGYAPSVLNVDVVGATESRARLELQPLWLDPPNLANPVAPVPVPPPPRPLDVQSPSTSRSGSTNAAALIGFGTAGIGLATIGFGAAFAMSAHDLDNASKTGGHCDARGCDAVGLPLRTAAYRRGDLATGLFIAGGVLLVGGISLYFVLGSSQRTSAPTHASSASPGH